MDVTRIELLNQEADKDLVNCVKEHPPWAFSGGKVQHREYRRGFSQIRRLH